MLFRFMQITNTYGYMILFDRLTSKCYELNGLPIKCVQCGATAIIRNNKMICPYGHEQKENGGLVK